jgi:hypothetical protein
VLVRATLRGQGIDWLDAAEGLPSWSAHTHFVSDISLDGWLISLDADVNEAGAIRGTASGVRFGADGPDRDSGMIVGDTLGRGTSRRNAAAR